MSKIKIGNRFIGEGEKPYFIADIAANHDGDINRAFKLIEMAKQAGADAAKFQNFKASKIVSKNGFKSLEKPLSHQSSWKKSVYEVYEEASIPEDWTENLKKKCDEVEIEYMTSPYDFQSVDLVDPFVNAFKIGSGDITWNEILHYIASKNKPVILATGASTMEDVERAMNTIYDINKNIIIMQCNTNYTANRENYKYVNLNVLKEYKKKFPNSILGLSDHTYGNATVLGAIALGACVIEKHFTDDNNRVGPDHKFSMNPTTWRDMVDRSIELWSALGNGIKKIELNEKETVMVQRRALYYTKDIKLGTVLSKDDLFPVRPIKEDGIPPYELEKLIGKVLVRDIKKDNYIKWEDVK
ncbi:N-acetylneuraminate synthase family protein [Clostridium magnum]|uniref:N,N'-diacetyllegionaminic acid synthase n=1 Tax=Clostridium magnum DSM 2767 TaxID=1121326 RepID=A0A161XHF7_9CLOT|nr:N-acetylneuraminate synthase family protein [Clostridium magnum]KZL94096.1 N,N'-diacetyllegionaminic acid synthase [Clostridium magnum DSM 2767]SHH95087.1 N-acetylneuraminate synthase [Clostridium magnum DSM 2767]